MSAKKIAPPAKETRDVPISFRVKPSLHRALQAAADADKRTLSQLISIKLEAVMRDEGFLK